MKKIALFLISIVLFISVKAQDDSGESVSIKAPKSDRVILGITNDIWQDAPDSMDIKTINRGFILYSMMDFPIKSSNFSFAPGIGVGIHNLYSDGSFNNKVNATGVRVDTVAFQPYDDTYKSDVNKFTVAYLDIPLELRYRTKNEKKSKQFKIAIGGKAGLMLSNYQKYKGKIGDLKVKQKEYNVENVEKFRYGATFRVGRGNWNLYGFYSLSKLFEEDKGPELYPITVGLVVTPF